MDRHAYYFKTTTYTHICMHAFTHTHAGCGIFGLFSIYTCTNASTHEFLCVLRSAFYMDTFADIDVSNAEDVS